VRRLALLLLAMALLSPCAIASALTAEEDAAFDGEKLIVSVRVTKDGATVEEAASSKHLPPLVQYQWVPAATPEGIGLEHLCNATGGPLVAPDPPWGWWYSLIGRDRVTGAVVSREARCVEFPDPGNPGSRPPAPPLPSPPTIGEVWNAVSLPAPQMQTSPVDRGVTGLETWFWVQSDMERQVAVTIDGYTVTGTARVIGYEIDTGDGAPVRAATPGTEQDPAVHHTYDTEGTYQVSVATRWRAEATMTAPGIATPITIDLGTAAIRTTRDYQVVEIRSQLTG
jgi:hypothetical protein